MVEAEIWKPRDMILVSKEDLEMVILAIKNGDESDAVKLLEEIIEEENFLISMI